MTIAKIKIVILTFNYGLAGKYPNGPGICLSNFCDAIKQNSEINLKVFSILSPGYFKKDFVYAFEFDEAAKAIRDCDILHLWSGIDHNFKTLIEYANKYDKKVIIGPNVIDTVNTEKEKLFLNNICYDKLLTVNNYFRLKISNKYKISLDKINVYLVGPDIELWKPSIIKNNKILWKGNGGQFVKDVDFALKIKDKLNKFEFEMLGYPKPYDYFEHIEKAKQCKVYISTSLSESMGLTLLESMAAGIPAIIHPGIYFDIINYSTAIISNKTIDSYCSIINELMNNKTMYDEISYGCFKYMRDNFNYEKVAANYIEIIN